MIQLNAKIFQAYSTKAYSNDDAQADRRKLAVLLDQAIDAMPQDSDPAEFAAIAGVLTREALTSAKRQGLLPVSQQIQTLTDCRVVLGALPICLNLPAFQAAAKTALRTAVNQE